MTPEQKTAAALALAVSEELDAANWGDIDPTWVEMAAKTEEIGEYSDEDQENARAMLDVFEKAIARFVRDGGCIAGRSCLECPHEEKRT